MPKRKPYLTVYLTEEEQSHINRMAGQAGLSTSGFVKAVCLAHEVKSIVDQNAVLALIQSKGDLGRLGGLLKLHLSNPGAGEPWHDELRQLLKQIEFSHREMLMDFRLVSSSYLKGNQKTDFHSLWPNENKAHRPKRCCLQRPR